jgi:hypothetical protein
MSAKPARILYGSARIYCVTLQATLNVKVGDSIDTIAFVYMTAYLYNGGLGQSLLSGVCHEPLKNVRGDPVLMDLSTCEEANA